MYSQCKCVYDSWVQALRMIILNSEGDRHICYTIGVGYRLIASHLKIDEAETRCFLYRPFVCFYLRLNFGFALAAFITRAIYLHHFQCSHLTRTSFCSHPEEWTPMTGIFPSNQRKEKRFQPIQFIDRNTCASVVETLYANVYIYADSCNYECNENFFFARLAID